VAADSKGLGDGGLPVTVEGKFPRFGEVPQKLKHFCKYKYIQFAMRRSAVN